MKFFKMQITYNVVTRSDLPFLENNDKGLKNPLATTAAFIQSTLSISAAAQLCTIVSVLKVARTSPALRAELMTALHAMLGSLMETKFKREAFSFGVTTICTTEDFILETCAIHVLYLLR